jgi:hypothetical protein
MRKRREINVFSISFLDLLSGALGAVIILYVAIPKNQQAHRPEMEAMEKELGHAKVLVEKIQRDLDRAQRELASKMVEDKSPPQPKKSEADAESSIGIRFKGKKVVFLIDTSYSMIEEERMGQVKGGLKMLLTNLSPGHEVDIVQYPFGMRAPFKSFWGRPREINVQTREEAFDWIYKLRPYGGTPTRDAMLFVLKNYDGITDLVVLSDGAPTLHNSNQRDDIYDILKVIREENPGKKVRISAIGVGSDFVSNRDSDQYKFLSLLAQEHDGFFMGF